MRSEIEVREAALAMDIMRATPGLRGMGFKRRRRRESLTMAFNVLVWVLNEVDTTRSEDRFDNLLVEVGNACDQLGINLSERVRAMLASDER